jgi:ribosomal protein S18 acetylase RimI-like enzyme
MSHSLIENCRSLLKGPDNYSLVARCDGETADFINFTTRKTIMHTSSSGLIDELVVSRNRRGQGIGKKLVLAAADKCRELGCSEIEVSTEKSNRNARRFYKNIGFEENAVLLEMGLD